MDLSPSQRRALLDLAQDLDAAGIEARLVGGRVTLKPRPRGRLAERTRALGAALLAALKRAAEPEPEPEADAWEGFPEDRHPVTWTKL